VFSAVFEALSSCRHRYKWPPHCMSEMAGHGRVSRDVGGCSSLQVLCCSYADPEERLGSPGGLPNPAVAAHRDVLHKVSVNGGHDA
jgi:hypothetical protein